MKIIDGNRKILFIDKHTTSYDKVKNKWNCDCVHGSIGYNHDKNPCKHTKLAEKYLLKMRALGVDSDDGNKNPF